MNIDASVLQFLYALRDPSVVTFFARLTELGSVLVIGGTTTCLVLFLFIRHRTPELLGLIATVGGSAGAVFVLKELVARARPDEMFRAIAESSSSFPSGHATLAIALYGFCIYLLWAMLHTSRWAGVVVGLLNLLIVSIAFSRLYLGVHYLSDVVAGLVVGGCFLAAGIYISERIKHRLVSS